MGLGLYMEVLRAYTNISVKKAELMQVGLPGSHSCDFLIQVSLRKLSSPNTFESKFPAHHWSRHLIPIPNSFLVYLLLQSLKNVSYAIFQHPLQPGWPCDAIPSKETEEAVSVGALGKAFSPLMQGADIAATTSPFSLP